MSIFSGLGSVGTMAAGAATVSVVVVGGIIVMEAMKADPVSAPPLAVIAPLIPEGNAQPASPRKTEPGDNIAPDLPGFDVVRVDAEGNALVAGRARANATVIVLIDGGEVSRVVADPAGNFAAIFTVPLSVQPRIVSLSMEQADGPAIASAASVILAPSVQPAPDTVLAQAPVGPATLSAEQTLALAEAFTDPVSADTSVVALQEPLTEIPAQAGTSADRPDLIAAIAPEPATELPVVTQQMPEMVIETAPDTTALAETQRPDPDSQPVLPTEVAGTVKEGGAPNDIAPTAELIAGLETDAEVLFESAEGPALGVSDPNIDDPGLTNPATTDIAAGTLDTFVETAPVTKDTPEKLQGKGETLSTQTVVVTQNATATATAAESETLLTTSAADVAPATKTRDATGETLTNTPSVILALAETDPAVQDPLVRESTGGPDLLATTPAAPDMAGATAPLETAAPEVATLTSPLAPVTPDAPGLTLLPDADTQPNPPSKPLSEPAAPSVLLADDMGIRVLQSGGTAPQVRTVVIDTITYDPEGDVALGGRGAGQGYVRAYLNNKPIETARIAADGQWRMPLPEVDTGVYTLRVDEVNESGTVTSRVETPFKREEPEVLAALDTRAEDNKQSAIAVLTVQPGNTLWGIASKEYGDGLLYVRVFEANKDRIRNPNLIYPGQVFALPE